ncbi:MULTISPECIES: hypothetical protein [unclassified Phenylobacterium]|uniref:hypothetical protein n=1 Tax=unclassified Phenylobacterium TaxID=2640670 RepID=UPI003F4FE848
MVDQTVSAMKKRAAVQGYSPEHHMTKTAPAPFVVKGTSTYFDRDGEVRGQWVKTTLDQEARHLAEVAAIEALSKDIPRVDPIERPAETHAALCNLYTFTDYHLGMLAWRKEGGADWDVKIAERLLVSALDHLVTSAPRARVGVINLQGDFLHYDGLTPVTPMHGHVLDADGRFSNMVAAAIRVIRRLIDIVLMRHDEVHLVIAEGNHDLSSSVWLRQMFTALYEVEPRLTVNQSEIPYYVHRHGKVMLAFHHGHMKKNEQLPLLFAAQFPEDWGATTKRYCHTGHRHHVEEREHSGMTVIQHPTLAARDAYAARGGWISERQASAITYHAEFGQVARNTVTPEMLEAA